MCASSVFKVVTYKRPAIFFFKTSQFFRTFSALHNIA